MPPSVSPGRAAARVDDLVRQLRARGHRLTPQRLAVLRVLADSTDHPSAEQVYQRLRPTYPMLSPATVYKTIDVLKAMGQILELEFREGANRYDVNIPVSHPHLVCTSCGRLEDFDVAELDRLAERAAAATGFRVLRHRLDFYGLCPACRDDRAD
jgi:Fur family transcriptional regulator, peroxide stress response regulator